MDSKYDKVITKLSRFQSYFFSYIKWKRELYIKILAVKCFFQLLTNYDSFKINFAMFLVCFRSIENYIAKNYRENAFP